MGVRIDYLPEAEEIRTSLNKCPECSCRTKYLQIYQYGKDLKIRCPKCNFYVVENNDDNLIISWNKPRKILSV